MKGINTLLICLFLGASKVYAQAPDLGMECSKCQVLPLYEFNKYIQKYTYLIENDSRLEINDFIIMVKLSNTIIWSHIKDEKSLKYNNLFYKKKLKIILKKLDCEPYTGMCYYSKKNKLFIGCQPDSKSMYNVQ